MNSGRILPASRVLSIMTVCLLLGSSACIRFTIVPTETEVGSHHVSIVPPCESQSTHSLRHQEEDGSSRIVFYEFKCGDTTILIRDNALSVNGKSYGPITEGDKIRISYGKVRVNSDVRAEVP